MAPALRFWPYGQKRDTLMNVAGKPAAFIR